MAENVSNWTEVYICLQVGQNDLQQSCPLEVCYPLARVSLCIGVAIFLKPVSRYHTKHGHPNC